MSANTRNARSAIRFAFGRFLAVTWGGFVAIALYLLVIKVGPTIEGKFFPVIEKYRITELREEPNGGVSFIPVFTKVRNCSYYGISWFAPDKEGNFVRIQVAPLETDPTAPKTGPMGKRSSDRQVLYPPPGSREIVAIMQHDCGMIWQTMTQLGPFAVRKKNGELVSRSRFVRVPSYALRSRFYP